MDEDWRNAFGILMCLEVCDGAGAGICDGSPSTCSSSILHFFFQKLGFIGLNYPIHDLDLKKSNLARTAVTQVVSSQFFIQIIFRISHQDIWGKWSS